MWHPACDVAGEWLDHVVNILTACNSRFGRKMKLLALFALVVAASLAQSRHVHRANPSLGDIWSNCGKDTDKMKIGTVSISPNPPKKGDTLMVKANVTFDEKVTGGEIKVSLVIDNIPFISTEFDLCAAASQAGLSCPIKAGPQTLTVSQEIPDEAPSGNYTGNQYVYDQDNNELACVALKLKL